MASTGDCGDLLSFENWIENKIVDLTNNWEWQVNSGGDSDHAVLKEAWAQTASPQSYRGKQ
jgi:hypothetical protein